MIFWRKKEKLMTLDEVMASLENNLIFARKMYPTFSDSVKDKIEKQHGLTTEQMITMLEEKTQRLKKVIESHPEIEKTMPDKFRKLITKEIRDLNHNLLFILKESGYENQ